MDNVCRLDYVNEMQSMSAFKGDSDSPGKTDITKLIGQIKNKELIEEIKKLPPDKAEKICSEIDKFHFDLSSLDPLNDVKWLKMVEKTIEKNCTGLFELLIFIGKRLGKKLDEQKINEIPLLHYVVDLKERGVPFVETLILSGVDLNKHDDRGYVALKYAVTEKRSRPLPYELLIQAKADLGDSKPDVPHRSPS